MRDGDFIVRVQASKFQLLMVSCSTAERENAESTCAVSQIILTVLSIRRRRRSGNSGDTMQHYNHRMFLSRTKSRCFQRRTLPTSRCKKLDSLVDGTNDNRLD